MNTKTDMKASVASPMKFEDAMMLYYGRPVLRVPPGHELAHHFERYSVLVHRDKVVVVCLQDDHWIPEFIIGNKMVIEVKNPSAPFFPGSRLIRNGVYTKVVKDCELQRETERAEFLQNSFEDAYREILLGHVGTTDTVATKSKLALGYSCLEEIKLLAGAQKTHKTAEESEQTSVTHKITKISGPSLTIWN